MEVDATLVEAALDAQMALYDRRPAATLCEMMAAALAVVIPIAQAAEREAILDLVENTPCTGEADDTETGHRYAAGYRDASQAARDELRRLRDAIRARAT